MTPQEIYFATSCIVVWTYRTELILLYLILRFIINIIDRLFRKSVQRSQWTHMSISPQSGARGLQRLHLLKYYNVQKGEVDSLWDWMLPKIRIISKNASNKSCWVLNSVQKSQWVHMSISSPHPLVKLGDSKDCHILKYYNIQK